MGERLVVFDIEVFNQDPTSVCAIGIVELIDLKVHSTYYSLIKPRNLSFDPYRYKVHKIKGKTLYHERTFDEVWKDIHHYFEESIVISHDIQGDMMYIREVLKYHQIPYPHLYMSCTNVLAHLLYPELQKYNLKDLSQKYGFEFKAHHALEDAKAAAYILVKMLEESHYTSLNELHEYFHLAYGEMKENYYRNIIAPESVSTLLQLSQKEESYLYHQSICFTGMLDMPRNVLQQQTKQVSALYSHQVTSQTNYLVIGKKGFYKTRYGNDNKKVKKALALKRKGQDIHIIHENEYLELLDKKREGKKYVD
ncbi:MAG: 3'-5' exoribonuclease [Erysipelotrichales bacterium]|nr:3'-5' exoribonuclease [Erysipelotrichales bacterium]